MRSALLYIIFLLQICYQNISAQQYFFTNYTPENGLSNPNVGCIVKDTNGFLWLATESGLTRFNGYDFTDYKSLASDSTTIPSNNVYYLLVDHDGLLWISTFRGLCVYENKKNIFRRLYYHTVDGKKIYAIECLKIFEDSKKTIWATTFGYGLLKYNREAGYFENVFSSRSCQSKNICSLIEDTDGTLWLSSYSHVIHCNPSDNFYKEFENRISATGSTFQGLKVIPDLSDKNYLWLTSWGDGLIHFNKLTGEFISYKYEPHASHNLGNIVFDVQQRKENKFWLATTQGIIVFDTEKKIFTGSVKDSINQKTIVNTQINCFFTDAEQITWIGTVDGLCNIHPDKQNFIAHPIWLNSPVPKYYYDEQEDKIYGIRFYTNRSLIIYDRKSQTENIYKIPGADELGAEPFSILKDNNDLLWIGTTKGIYTFNEQEKKFKLLEVEPALHIPDRSIYAGVSFKDSRGNLWFSCYGKGLLMVDAKKQTLISYFHDKKNKNSFPVDGINRITEDSEKMIYVSDEFRGIAKINSEKRTWEFLNANENKYAVLAGTTDMALDKRQNIWVTTKNNGLVCIDEQHRVTIYIKDEIGNLIDEHGSITVDTSGMIWMTAVNGLHRFNPFTKTFMRFTVQDGLPARTISESLFLLRDGSISYFFNKWIYKFNPESVIHKDKPLNVHLTSLSVNGKISSFSNVIDEMDTIRLSHVENNLTVEFAATNFTNPSSTLYSCMLEGNDNNWSAPSRTRAINFSKLSPGDYYLRIRTGENSPDKKIFIQIIPAWWQTAWFKWFVVFLFITILFYSIRFFLSIRYKQKIAGFEKQREIENIRMRISRDIHDEIGSGLTKIKFMSRNLSKESKSNGNTADLSQKISSASEELIQNLGEIVWTINPANDTLENIFAFIRNYLSKLFDENPDIKLRLDFPEPENIPNGILINPEVKRNLLLILKECITNIFKHAQATEVNISLQADKSKIEMKIRDNGKGLNTQQQTGFGNGIKNMHKRAESVQAQFTMESSMEKGTNLYLLIPLNES